MPSRLAARVAYSALLLAAIPVAAAHAQAASAVSPGPAGSLTLRLDPANSSVHWTLGSTLHTVHGTFNLKAGELKFDPAGGAASGSFVALATSGASGNDSRDKKMHKEILESTKFPEVVFQPTKVEGSVASEGISNVQLHGTFLLHGSTHEITVPVQAELHGGTWKGSANFSIPYVAWGLKSPNTFLLKADPAVQIELALSGSVEPAPH